MDSDKVTPSSRSFSTDSSLIAAIRARDPTAWQRFVRLYSPLVFHWCRQASLNSHDSADVMQEVFGSVVTGIAAFQAVRAQDTFRGWLWTITRNKLRDFYRRSRRRPKAAGGTDAEVQLHNLAVWVDRDGDLSQSDEGLSILGRTAIAAVQAEFEDRTWQAFYRTTVGTEAPADVARDLGISVNAVYKAKCRVLSRLRQLVGDLL
jgi:RNA polymerase sigma-70 factor (ECF subfamily)